MGTIAVGTVAFSFFDADLSPTQALYFSIVTVTTVSYGDYTPQSDAARGFIALFALFGPVLLARALAAIATFPLERRRVLQQQRVLEQSGGELDANELEDLQKTLLELELCNEVGGTCSTSGESEEFTCSASDFALAIYMRQEKCSPDDVKMVLTTFNELDMELDIDGSGELDDDDVKQWIERKKAEAVQPYRGNDTAVGWVASRSGTNDRKKFNLTPYIL